jgi:hypothetical protein
VAPPRDRLSNRLFVVRTYLVYYICHPPYSTDAYGIVTSWRRAAEHLMEKAGQRLRIFVGRNSDEFDLVPLLKMNRKVNVLTNFTLI